MKQIYNEGRVVGYSSYDIYVRQLLSSDPTAVPMTEREWLTNTFSESCSMILKIPAGTRKGYHDYILPRDSQLCCCTALYASLFEGEVTTKEGENWAIRVDEYSKLSSNTSHLHPATPGNPEDVPTQPNPEDMTDEFKARCKEFTKITSGLMFQPGEWAETRYFTPLFTQSEEIVVNQQGLELLVPVQDSKIAVNIKPDLTKCGFLRFAVTEDIQSDTYLYLHGFVNRAYLSGEISYNMYEDSVNPESGDFLGPAVYPWACPIILVVTTDILWVRVEDLEHEWAGDLTEVKRRITNLETRATNLETDVTSLKSRTTALETSMSTAQTDITGLKTRCTNIETKNSNQDTEISGLKTRMTTAEGSISTNTSDITALKTRCTNIETKNTSQDNSIASLGTRMTSAESSISTNTSDITALKTRCTNIEAKNTSQDTSISSLTTRMSTAEGTITTNTSDITALKTRCTNIETKNTSQDTEITNLKTRCTNIETKNTQQDTSIGQLQTDFTAFKNTVNTRCTDIESVNTDQSNELADHETRITALENSGSVSALERRVSAIEADYVKSSQISDMATKTWVGQQGYLTSGSLSGYATETWVNNKGYVTSSALSGYATESWVSDGYVDKSQYATTINNLNSYISGVSSRVSTIEYSYITSSDLDSYAKTTFCYNTFATKTSLQDLQVWVDNNFVRK